MALNDYEDRTVRFDWNTGLGQGSVYATESYDALGARFARRDGFGHDHGMAYDWTAPGASVFYDSAGVD